MRELIARYFLVLIILRMAAVPFGDEEIALARIIQGEAGHEFMAYNSAPAYCVGWVVRNRLASGEYGSSYQEIAAGFNGTLNRAPKWRYMAIARLVMSGHEDPTGGALYVLSQQDVEGLNFDVERATLVLRASPGRALYFFREWQGEDVRED